MFLNKAKFVRSMSAYNEDALENLPQIAVVGKSNVGKSSFINCVTNNGKLCKVGNTPGKTRLINFFIIEDSFYFADLPGYGYAKRSKQELKEWGVMIEGYLKNSSLLKYIILLIDIRNGPSQGDIDMMNWIRYYGKEAVVICTKAEKIAKTKRKPFCFEIAKKMDFNGCVLPIDSCSGYGRDAVVEMIKEKIS